LIAAGKFPLRGVMTSILGVPQGMKNLQPLVGGLANILNKQLDFLKIVMNLQPPNHYAVFC
jgi:hypothetical protein